MLAVVRACTLDMNADGSMPVMRVKTIWDAAYRAGDTSRAFSFRRFTAIRDMLSDMGFLEWEDETYSFGKACKWRASGELMGMIEEALNAGTTINSSSLSILVCNSVEEARRDRPDHVGLRPKRIFPSDLREDWDENLREAGQDRLSRDYSETAEPTCLRLRLRCYETSTLRRHGGTRWFRRLLFN